MKKNLLLYFITCLVLWNFQAFGQTTAPLIGSVTSTDGIGLPGVLVSFSDTDIRTITDENGGFSLNAPDGAYLLMASYIGMESFRLPVTLPTNDPISIVLKQSELELSQVDVVSTGYQQLPKERATGSFAFLDSQLVQRKVGSTILDRLEDVTSGLIFNRGSNAANDPLSIRGRSTIYANTSPLIIVDNFPYDGPMENINPNDVESITVLKDAAAASIWGARAGNGVIVITTQKGKSGQPLKVSLNSNFSVTEARDLYYVPQMSIPDFIGIEQQLFENKFYRNLENNANKPKLPPVVETAIALRDGKISQAQADEQLMLYRQSDIRKGIKENYLRPAINQQYAINLTGGNTAHTYNISLGYDRLGSDIIGNAGNRWTLAIGDSWKTLNDKLEIGLRVNLANQNTQNRTDLPNGYSYDRLRDDDGNPLPLANLYSTRYINSLQGKGLLDWRYIPLNEIGKWDENSSSYDLRISPSIQYTLTPDLKIGVFYQYWKNMGTTRNRAPQELFFSRDLINKYTQINEDGSLSYPVPKGDILSTSQSDAYSHTFRPILSYTKTLDSDHSINAIAGMEIRDLERVSWSDRYYGYRDDMGISIPVDLVNRYPFYYNKGQLGSVPSNSSHGGNTDRFISYYTNLGYDFRHRYFLSVSARKDQANIFGVDANQRGVPLRSIGAAWIISEEKFMNGASMPFLKFRATYGYSGNVDKSLSSAVTAQYVNFQFYDVLPQLIGATIINPPNPDLRWEKVRTTNLALDMETQNGLITTTVEYYSKHSKDLLGEYSVPSSTGRTSFKGNFAETRVRGIDISLSANIFRNSFRWTSSLLYSGLREKVLDFEKDPTVTNLLSSALSSAPYPMVGKPLFGVYSYEWAGLDPDTGDPMGILDGEPSKDYLAISRAATIDNLQYHGPGRPTGFGAFRNDFAYKGFSLSVNISYRFGYYVKTRSIDYFTLLRGSIGHGDFDRRWKNSGDELTTQVPSMPASADSRRNSFYTNSAVLIEKGDHIRLNDIRLAYTLSHANAGWLPFHSAQIYSYASNLGIIWKASDDGLDPDYQYSKPLRSVSFGLKLDF